MNIKRLRHLLLLVVTLLALTVVWYALTKYRPWDIRIPVIQDRKKLPDFEFSGVTISEVSGPDHDFSLKASDLKMDKEKGEMQNVQGSLFASNKPSFLFTAHKGLVRFNVRSGVFTDFIGETVQKPIWTITAGQAVWDQNSRTIVIQRNPVLKQGEIMITAEKFTYFIPFQFTMLENNVDVKYGEFHMTCQKATIKDTIETISLDGQIFIEGKDLKARTDFADIGYGKNQVMFKNNVVFESKQAMIHADQVVVDEKKNTVTFTNAVKLGVKDISIGSNRAVLDRNTNIIEFFENTEAWKGQLQIESNKIMFDLNAKDFVAAGGGRTKITKNE
jgi:lipopolysaccharide export system protein LptA